MKTKDNKQFALTDKGNAERLVHHYGHQLRYVTRIRSWYHYEGGRWQPDDAGRVVECAKQTVQRIVLEADLLADDLPPTERVKAEKEIARWAHTSQSAARLRAMVELAQSDLAVVTSPDVLDAEHHLLNVANKTLDLRSLKHRPPRPEDLLTKQSAARFDKKATCSTWEKFLERVLPDAPVREFVQRAAGYALTGDTGEHCFFLLYGTGRNGKSTFLKVLQHVLGDYARSVRVEAFLKGRSDNQYYDLATLFGARLVWASEPPQGRHLNEALLKSITGGDPVQARFLYKDFFEYEPTYKLFLASNNRPKVTEDNEGFWSRVRLLPFTVQIPEAERDPALFEKLVAERDGILRWMIRGYRAYQQQGLAPPDAVVAATDSYRSDNDALGQFLDECVERKPGKHTSRRQLYEAWRFWSDQNGEHPGTQREFTQRAKERGLKEGPKYNGCRRWRNISVAPPPHDWTRRTRDF